MSATPTLRLSVHASGRVSANIGQSGSDRNPGSHAEAELRPRRFPGQVIKKPLLIQLGGITVRIYKTREYKKHTRRWYHSHTIVWHDAHGRHREKRDDLGLAKERAENICRDILAGNASLLTFNQADRACLQRSQEILAAAGIIKPLELVVSEYSESFTISRGASPIEIARFWALHHTTGESRNAGEIYQAMLRAREKDGSSKNTVADIKSRVGRFVKTFPGQLLSVTSADINKWLRELTEVRRQGDQLIETDRPVSRRTRNNYRGNLIDLYNFARESGDIPKEWNPLDDVAKAKNEAIRIDVFTPDQAVELLGARVRYEKESARKGKPVKTLVPFLSISFWCGCRHEEMCSPGLPTVEWSDVDFEQKELQVRKEVARKIGCDRIVPLQPNILEWLKPYAKPNGPICDYANATNELKKTAELAGIKWKDNGGRKSFISYRLAVTKNIGQVADEAGTSPERIRANYKKLKPEREGKRWFNIFPTNAQVLQLRFAGV